MTAAHPNRSHRLLACALAAGLTGLACGHTPTEADTVESHTGAPPRTVVLAVGQGAPVDGSRVLTLEKVTSDSRCPTGVQCAWAGEVALALTLKADAGVEPFALSDRSNSATVHGLLFELLSVEPYPAANSTIEESAYRASIRVSGLTR